MPKIYNMTDIWNDGGSVMYAIKMNVDDQASLPGSKIIDLQIDNITIFSVDKAGNIVNSEIDGMPHAGDNVSLFANDALYISSGDSISVLVNDSNFIASGNNISFLVNDANYLASGDNVSFLLNDANYLASGDNVSFLVNDANYLVSGDNVSLLTNDANYMASGDNISFLNNDAGYVTSANGIATDTIWDVKGNLIVASGNDVAGILAPGADNQRLVSDSNETLGVKWVKESFDIIVSSSDETTDLEVGVGTASFRIPFSGDLTEVRASVTTAPVGADLVVNINKNGSSVLSTKLSIDDGEKTSTTAVTPFVISDAVLPNDSEISIDIDEIGTTTAGAGLKVTLKGTK